MSAEKSVKLTIPVSTSIGKVSALLYQPSDIKAVLVLAHGAGAGMTHPFMESLSFELMKLGVASLRYNFPYMENKKGRPDPPPIAEKTVEVVVVKANELFPKTPLFAGGKSFGGRMTSQRLAKECPEYVKGIVFFGFPLHAPGKSGTERADHLFSVHIPMLFLQGTRDSLADIKLISKVSGKLKKATLVKFENADHSFKAPKQNLIPRLAEETANWMKTL